MAFLICDHILFTTIFIIAIAVQGPNCLAAIYATSDHENVSIAPLLVTNQASGGGGGEHTNQIVQALEFVKMMVYQRIAMTRNRLLGGTLLHDMYEGAK